MTAEGFAARDEALDALRSTAWRALALRAGRYVATRQAEFTTDDIWLLLDRYGVGPPHEPRAMGPVMLRLVADGVCRQTGRRQPTVRVVAHAHPQPVYESLIYGQRYERLVEAVGAP